YARQTNRDDSGSRKGKPAIASDDGGNSNQRRGIGLLAYVDCRIHFCLQQRFSYGVVARYIRTATSLFGGYPADYWVCAFVADVEEPVACNHLPSPHYFCWLPLLCCCCLLISGKADSGCWSSVWARLGPSRSRVLEPAARSWGGGIGL